MLPLAELLELDAVDGGLALALNTADPHRVNEAWGLGEAAFVPEAVSKRQWTAPSGYEVAARVARVAAGLPGSYSPVEVLLSSERLAGFIVAESCLSLAGLEDGGGMLMLGLSMVVLVDSVPACGPFLSADEAAVAESRV